MSLSYFSANNVLDGTSVVSYINWTDLVTAIQNDYVDTYFDSTSKITRADVYYYQQPDGRQVKQIRHTGSFLTGNVSWSSFARDGTWAKNRIMVYNHDGATHNLTRAAIGTSEDIVHSDGTMILNIS